MPSSYKVQSVFQTDIGLKRSRNEDAQGSMPLSNGYLFIVCDGMGGHAGGEWASRACVDYLIEYFTRQVNEQQNPSVSLHNAIIYANEQIYATAAENAELKGMGTTLVALLFFGDEIYTAHVGDSRIYVLHDNEFIQLTKDHSFVQGLVDQGIISRVEAESHPRKNELTNALGVRKTVVPEINVKSFKAVKGDRFLLCSDGLCGIVPENLILETLKNFSNATQCGQQLIQYAHNAGAPDNITLQIVDIDQSPFTSAYYNYTVNGRPLVKKKIFSKKILIVILSLVVISISVLSYVFIFKKDKPEKEIPKLNNQTHSPDSNNVNSQIKDNSRKDRDADNIADSVKSNN